LILYVAVTARESYVPQNQTPILRGDKSAAETFNNERKIRSDSQDAATGRYVKVAAYELRRVNGGWNFGGARQHNDIQLRQRLGFETGPTETWLRTGRGNERLAVITHFNTVLLLANHIRQIIAYRLHRF
jgi:hypothetical protein